MPKSCIVCSIAATPNLQLQYCARCQSALYCSRACQRKDWKKQHKKICKLLNVGHGDMQVRCVNHMRQADLLKEDFERIERSLREGMKRFFKLFKESTFEGSRAVAQKMKKFAKHQTKNNQKLLLYHSMCILVHSSNLEMLSWPNSPLLVMLQFVDPNVLYPAGGDEATSVLHLLADLTDPFDYTTHENQLILAKQLIERGANVNAVSIPKNETPLHRACFSGNVTNLDFVELLLEAGADPNIQDQQGQSSLMCTTECAPGAAKFLLNWPTTDANITTRSGCSFPSIVRIIITDYSEKIALPDNPQQIQRQFLLQQWIDIEEMLVERGARYIGNE